MALGLHWEWRAFGAVSSGFADRYTALQQAFPTEHVEDNYLWIPRLEVNAKFRRGTECALKFKRLRAKDGSLEQWDEDPAELFDFPLQQRGWETLQETLNAAGLHLAPYPASPPDLRETLHHLQTGGCAAVVVDKVRESRIWRGSRGVVKVEWACISAPEAILSVGLETWPEAGKKRLTDDEAKADLRAAIEALGVESEPLSVLNYMDAVRAWAKGERI